MIGNGGSATTPSHSAGDWSKELGIPTIAHTDNISSFTAWANDTEYANVFAGQLSTFAKSGDLVIAYSGSGNSPNVLNGISLAKEMVVELSQLLEITMMAKVVSNPDGDVAIVAYYFDGAH